MDSILAFRNRGPLSVFIKDIYLTLSDPDGVMIQLLNRSFSLNPGEEKTVWAKIVFTKYGSWRITGVTIDLEYLGLSLKHRFATDIVLRCSPPKEYARRNGAYKVVNASPVKLAVKPGDQINLRLTLRVMEAEARIKNILVNITGAFQVITDVIQPALPAKGNLAWATLGFIARAKGVYMVDTVKVIYSLDEETYVTYLELPTPVIIEIKD